MCSRTKTLQNIVTTGLIGLVTMLAGCATPETPAQRIERHKNVSIYELLKWDSRIKYSQDAQGNLVSYQSDNYLQEREFKNHREGLEKFTANCIANGGRFDIEKQGSNNLKNAISSAKSASWGQAVATYEFWNQLGISGTADAMRVFHEQLAGRTAMAQRMAFIFDSAVRTENVGTFACMNSTTSEVKWRINRDLYNVRQGYRSPSGMYNFPDAYTVSITETVVVYEKQTFASTNTGYTQLPERSESLVYPVSGYYVVIEPNSAGWQVVSATHFRSPAGNNSAALINAPKRVNKNQEIVILSEDGRFAAPAYREKLVRFAFSDNDISRNRCHVDLISNRLNYSICNSAFGDAPREYGTGMKVLGSIFGADPNTEYNMKLTRTVSFVPQSFWVALDQANVRDAIAKVSANASKQAKSVIR